MNHFKDIFGKTHWKKHTIKKFPKWKMITSLFTDFYSKFILLLSDLEYKSKTIIWKLKHKLMKRLQDQWNLEIKLIKIIFALVKHCLSIYKQLQATIRIKEKAKFSTTIQTLDNVLLRAVRDFFWALISYNNTYSSHLSNSLWGVITYMHQNADSEISRLMKERRCFHCK